MKIHRDGSSDDTQEQFTRIFFNGRRTKGEAFTEFRDRNYGPVFTVTISGPL